MGQSFWFFAWWGGLPTALRFTTAFAMHGLAAVAFFLKLYIWLWMVPGVSGIVMLLAAFPTRGERKGYHDF